MNLELISWIIAWIIVTEIIFVWMIKDDGDSVWGLKKLGSLLIAGIIILIHFVIVRAGLEDENYFRLVYEALVLGGIGLFFYINKLLANKLTKKK